MKRITPFVLLLFTACQCYSQNLVSNPGFELWQKVNKPTGWTTALSCLKDSSVIVSGIYSCRQSTTTDSKELGQIVAVTAGVSFRLSVQYKNDPAATGNGCRIWSNWKDSEGNSITDDISQPLLRSGYLKSETWNEYSAEITSPENSAYLNLILRTLPNSITFWDDIVFEESIPTSRNENGFENITVYPNPAYNYLIINNIQQLQQIDIQTITGTRIWSRKISGEESIRIPVAEFMEGLYIVIMRSQGKKYVIKFIKAKH